MGLPAYNPGLARIGQTPRTGTVDDVPDQTAVADSTAVNNPVNKGWVGNLRSLQRRDVGGAQTQGTSAAKIPMVEVLANARALLADLDDKLNGSNPDMRDQMNDALANGTAVPEHMRTLAKRAKAVADEINIEKGSLPPEEQNNLMLLLDMKKNFKFADATIKALPDDETSPIGGALGTQLSQMSDISTPEQMKAVMAAAAKDGMSPGDLADELISGKGAISDAMSNKLGPAALQTLAMALSRAPPDVPQTMERLDGLQLLAGRGSPQSQWSPQSPNTTGQMSATDMRRLIQSGQSPTAITDQVLSGQGPMRGRMTLDSLNALESKMVPQPPMSAADKQQFMQRIQGLDNMRQGLQAMPIVVQQRGAQTFDPQAARMALNPLRQGTQSNAAMSNNATLDNGMRPTGDHSADLAGSIANASMYSDDEKKLLDQIKDPNQRAMQALQMQQQKQALIATMLTNLANMRHEMLKAVANNLRS